MPIKIINTKNNQTEAKINMLVYGHGGVGKTTFATTAPKPIIADCEGGTTYMGKRGISVDVVRINTWEDIEEFYKLVKKSDYETIIIDPINEALEKLTDYLKKKNPRLTNQNEALTLQGWGLVKEKMRNFLKTLRDMEKHLIIIAHVDEKQDEASAIKKRPRLQANLTQELINQMDIVAYMQVIKSTDGTVKRILRVQPESDYFEAKDRTNTLGDIVEPDFTNIVKAVVENKQFAWTKKIDKEVQNSKEKFINELENNKTKSKKE